jgi:hypothetical protein
MLVNIIDPKLWGSLTRIFTEVGWEISPEINFACWAKICLTSPPTLANASSDWSTSVSYKAGSNVTYTCNSGLSLNPLDKNNVTQISTCQAVTGAWSPLKANCTKLVTCNGRDLWPESNMNAMRIWNTTMVQLNDTAMYKCLPGFSFTAWNRSDTVRSTRCIIDRYTFQLLGTWAGVWEQVKFKFNI